MVPGTHERSGKKSARCAARVPCPAAPGLSRHTRKVQVTGAYGLRRTGIGKGGFLGLVIHGRDSIHIVMAVAVSKILLAES